MTKGVRSNDNSINEMGELREMMQKHMEDIGAWRSFQLKAFRSDSARAEGATD